MNRTIYRLIIICLTIIGLQGCEQRELCYDHSHGAILDIEFDWSQEPDAEPATMVVWAFPEDGGDGTRAEFSNIQKDGKYQMRVSPGKYVLVCYNGETEFNHELGKTLDELTITTYESTLLAPLNRGSENAPRPPFTDGQEVRNEASHIYMDKTDNLLEVVEHSAHSLEIPHYSVKFTPKRATAIWNIRIEDIQNFNPNIVASAIVTGVARDLRISDGRPVGDDVTVPFALTTCGEGCLKASVVLFGDAAPHDVTHYLRVYTTLQYYYTYDITDIVHDAPDPKNVDIVIRGLVLPDTGSGMSPGVSEWDDAEEIELPM